MISVTKPSSKKAPSTIHKFWVCAGFAFAATQTQAQSVAAATPVNLGVDIVHACANGLLGGKDGGVKTDPGDPDGAKSGTSKAVGITSALHADLGISSVSGIKKSTTYSLLFCVVNRGGKAAQGPMTVQLRVGDKVINPQTEFKQLASKEMTCFGNLTDQIPTQGIDMTDAMIVVSAAANEYSARDNVCRIVWNK